MVWALLARMSGGKSSGHSTIIWHSHFPLRTSFTSEIRICQQDAHATFVSHKRLTLTFVSHKRLTLTKVNTYGLLYEWKGADSSLKPLLLAAHQG